MALPVTPNTSNFLGVALVINRSRDGPQFVFHYPPHVVPPGGVQGCRSVSGPSECCANDGDVDNDDDDILLGRSSAATAAAVAGGPSMLSPDAAELLMQWNHDDHLVTDSGTQIVPWEHVAGFPTKDLENILTPARAYHKRLFQVSLDPLYCVSYPIYVPDNGVWKRKKQKQPKTPRAASTATTARKDDEQEAPPTDTDSPKNEETKASDADQAEAGKEKGKAGEESEDKKSSMTMFNLVFILKPNKHEVKDLVDVMFTHLIKKINKAYKYCQQRSDFVWKESKKILALKDKGREDKRKMSVLWGEILGSSSLAASMQDIYDAVSQNRIAALQLDTAEGMVTHSVQIPMPFHVSDLPQEGEGGQRGLWLTTANSFMGDDAFEEPDYLDKNFGLLLMDDEKKITAELQTDPDETTLAMIEFVRHSKPTLSFHQVAQQSSNILTPAQVRKFAQHFIFWRRAIAIPPLHARDMYVVSPNCDLAKLPQAASRWARQFPLSPPLPNFLAELSVAPRPYKLHCPSKSHRAVYMAMLAWLMRGGWVTQLCTFAYVVVWPEIVYEVEYVLEAEEIAKAKRHQQQLTLHRNHSNSSASHSSENSNTRPSSPLPSSTAHLPALRDAALAGLGSGLGSVFLPLTGDNNNPVSSTASDWGASSTTSTLRDLPLSHSHSLAAAAAAAAATAHSDSGRSSASAVLSPTSTASTGVQIPLLSNNPNHDTPLSPTSTAMPAEQAAEKARLERIADKAARELAERATAHARKAVPEPTLHPSVNKAQHLAGISPHIILDAKKATGKESLYLSAIGRRLRERAEKAAAAAAAAGSERDQRESNPGSGAASSIAGSSTQRGGVTDTRAGKKPEHVARNDERNRDGRDGKDGANANGSSSSRDGRDWDERVANAWPKFWKYFNGRSALERIALQEEMKRKDVWNLLTAMSEYLLTVRHW